MSAVLLRRRRLGRGSTNGISGFSEEGITVVRNWIDPFPADMSLVFRWGCTSEIPGGVNTVNTAAAIHWCSDKRQSRLDMQEAGVPVPETWVPESFRELGNAADSPFSNRDRFVARPRSHAQGRQISVGSFGGLHPIYEDGYVSRLIDKVAEYRVMVVSNRVAWVARKTPGNPDEVAWNVARGGRFDNVRWGDWPLAVCNAALQAAKVGQLDFGGVDVMVDADGMPYVLEVNSAPSQTSPYRQECLAHCFDYIVRMGKEHFDDRIYTSWRHLIHPALMEEE